MQTTMTDLPRILIVGTLPYHPNESSRALDTYFHDYPQDHLRMIFSNGGKPYQGHCESYYEISDKMVLKHIFQRKKPLGVVYSNDSLSKDAKIQTVSSALRKKTTLRYYLRYYLWHKNWLSNELLSWADEFKPEAIYISFSDDYFILEIAEFFANRYNIPVIPQIGDDYYFVSRPLFVKPYFKKYKLLFDNIMQRKGFGVYISSRIASKYNGYFKLQGTPIFLESGFNKCESFKNPIYEFNYFGKIDNGRLESLMKLGDALYQIDSSFCLNVFAVSASNKEIQLLQKHHCRFNESISYRLVVEKMNSGSFNIVASSFKKKYVEMTKYSLSTKVSDSLAAAGVIIAIGDKDDGAIQYLNDNKAAIIIDNAQIDIFSFKKAIFDIENLKIIKANANDLFMKNHLVLRNRNNFLENCSKLKNNE